MYDYDSDDTLGVGVAIISSLVSIVLFVMILHAMWVADWDRVGKLIVSLIVYGIVAAVGSLIGSVAYLFGVIGGMIVLWIMWT